MASPVEAAGPCGESPDRPHKPRKPVAADKRLAQQAGILCADRVFWRFLTEKSLLPISERDAITEERIAEMVRYLCRVRSRSEIIPGTPAAECWIELESQFTAWKLAA